MRPNRSKNARAGLESFGQAPLWHETPEDAARALGEAYQGPEGRGLKALAGHLRPHMPGDAAHRWLLAALNNERAEKLSGSDWLALMKIGRTLGVHCLTAHLLAEAGYAPPQPIDPEDEHERLTREFVDAVDRLDGIKRALEKNTTRGRR